jgi:hypothetical protein
VAWVLLDVVIGVLALLVLGLVALGLYRRVRVLLSRVGAASGQLGELSAGLTVTPPRQR